MIRGALIGTGVALLCFLPPLLHFLFGPFAPLIGGFIGGSNAVRRTPGPLVPLGVGLLIGAFLAIISAIVGIPIVVIMRSIIDQPSASVLFLALIPLTAMLWGSLLGIAGAYLGASLRGQPSPQK